MQFFASASKTRTASGKTRIVSPKPLTEPSKSSTPPSKTPAVSSKPVEKKVAQGKSSGPKSTRPRSRGAARKAPAPAFVVSPAQQEQLIGFVLLVIAALTLIGVVVSSGGTLLEGWTHVLSVLFGWGRYFAPFFFGGLGAWLILDSLDRRPDIGWERPLALIILFFCIESVLQIVAVNFMDGATTSFATAQAGQGGGLVGHALYGVMVGGLGLVGALLVLFVLFCIGLILLFNISLPQLANAVGQGFDNLRAIFFQRASDIRITRNGRDVSTGRERIPPEMVTAPPRDDAYERRRSNNEPRIPADFGMDEPEPVDRNTPIPRGGNAGAARLVGGSPAQPMVHREWRLPRVPDILEESPEQEASPQEIRERVKRIEETLAHFGVPAKVIEVNQGPTITQFGVEPGFLQQKAADGTMRPVKVKVNRISALQHDLELALAAAPIRVEAPVPGKPIVGIEVPNSQISRVSLRSVMESDEFQRVRGKSPLAFALGQDVSGQPIVADLAKMPHLLVAGATGSGKSVAINAMITCMIMTNTPDELQFVMVDPKRVELSSFNGIPHLLAPVVVDMDLAVAALNRTVQEMDDRYKRFSQVGARNIETYNALPDDKRRGSKLPFLILVVDELADLMMTSPDEVEHTITRLAQMARATGIHLVLATQRPSVDVVTGLIKANFPSRISFAVTSQVDSRVVLDTPGAEKLLGRGDMLYMASDSSKLSRLQGCFVSDRELEKLVKYWQDFIMPAPQGGTMALPLPNAPQARVSPSSVVRPPNGVTGDYTQGGLWSDLKAEPKKSEEDDLLDQAIQIVQDNERASVSLLQRKLRIGYSRAARLMELLEQKGYVGDDEGPTKGREVMKGNLPTDPTTGASGFLRLPSNSPPPPSAPKAPSSSSGIIKANPGAAKPPANKPAPRPGGGVASKNTGAPASRENRSFEGDDLGNFDDFTDADWDDLNK